jgi:NitT/TauT family transport system substrate-binding protein
MPTSRSSRSVRSQLDRRGFITGMGRWGGGLLAGASALRARSSFAAQVLESPELNVGYLPITDAAPLLVAHGKGFFEAEGLNAARPTLLRSWPQVAEAFQARKVDVVHLLMPMTIWLRFGQAFPLKVVAWDHVDGSALTVAPDVTRVEDLAGKTVAVPFWYSIHNVILQQLLRHAGLRPVLKEDPSREARTVKLVVMAPPDMPPALARGAIAGFIVADPFNALAEINHVGRILRFTGDVWQHHACCVVVMRQDDIERRPVWAQAVVSALAKAQVYTRNNRADVAKLLSNEGAGYLPQPRDAIERALTHYDAAEYGPPGAIHHAAWGSSRIDFQPFPYPSYTETLVGLLKDTLVEGDTAFLRALDPKRVHADLVDDRFARKAIAAAGGAGRFGVDASWRRRENIEP